MSKSIILKAPGGVENFEISTPSITEAKGNEVTIDQKFISINYSDILLRTGVYQADFPLLLGSEGIGVISKISSENKFPDLKEGMRIAYATAPYGAYTEKRNIDFKYCVVIPDDIDDLILAGCFSKALTAHYLLRRVVRLREGQTILVHGAAGGVGHILCQMATSHNIKVIGTVNSPDKVSFAQENGCIHVIDTSSTNFVDETLKFTNGIGVDVIFDLIGGDFISKSIDCLNYLGIVVSCGDTAGTAPILDLSKLDKKCAYVTRTRLEVYRFYRLELLIACEDVFDLIRKGAIKPHVNEYKFNEIPKAHKDIEQGTKNGSYVVRL
ncbi:MAG: zinc-binding dehydrogenase [Alphaproteobacteria bacterium]|nr:zinc-binding dehydrogenase [Alphaproteobacteria bacterium]OJV13846.1 MAG: hypothetical protein BGO27_08105 [Alphaproteobacteria bacterium 33-17]